MRSFADAALTSEVTERYTIGGIHHITVPTEPIGYLQKITFRVLDGDLQRVELRECNAARIFEMPGELLPLLGNEIPLQVDDQGNGCLPNMSAACAYRLMLQGSCHVEVTYHIRPLPAVRGLGGEEQKVAPPNPMIMQLWSTVFDTIPRGEGHPRMPLCGNYIRELVAVFETGDGPLRRFNLQGRPVLRYDLLQLIGDDPVARWGVEETHPSIGVYRWKFRDPGLPTVVATLIELACKSRQAGEITWLVNELIVPDMAAGREILAGNRA